MKKSKVLLLLALSSSLVLFGCGNSTSVPNVNVEQVSPTDRTDTTDSDADISNSDLPPSEGMVRSRITNEWIPEEQNNTRPIAIMVPNSATASYFGVSDASVLYEVNVEGDMTRLMAIIDDWSTKEKMGNIRSCRDYFVYWSFEWDAIVIHYGGPFYINDLIGREDTDNIDCILQPDIGKFNNAYTDIVYRDEAKNDTDNAFTSAERIRKACDTLGISLTYRSGFSDEQHYKFAPAGSVNTLDNYPDAFVASKIDMSDAYPLTNSYFEYNEETGTYDRFQCFPNESAKPHIDAANNKQLTFENVIVQNTYYEVRDQKGYLVYQCHDTTRDGWYFTKGKGIHITWRKESDYGATRYYDDNGNEIEMNTGKTMILIMQTGDAVYIDGNEYYSDTI